MTTREEIKEWAFVFLRPLQSGKGFTEDYADELTTASVNDFFRGLSKRGVVKKVEREVPQPILGKALSKQDKIYKQTIWEYAQETMLDTGYVATEPLIEEE